MTNTLYFIESEAERIEKTFSAFSAQLIVLVRARLSPTFPVGCAETCSTIALNAPQLRGAACVLERGAALLIGASLTPLGC